MIRIAALLFLAFFAGCAVPEDPNAPVRYVCSCGPDCDCKTKSDEPGKCACGEYLVPE
ncbi:MAG: hypothetical protein ACPG4K_11565 [Haloferula sp.]